MCRGELSAAFARVEAGGSGSEELKKCPPPSPVIRECSWKKTQMEQKILNGKLDSDIYLHQIQQSENYEGPTCDF